MYLRIHHDLPKIHVLNLLKYYEKYKKTENLINIFQLGLRNFINIAVSGRISGSGRIPKK